MTALVSDGDIRVCSNCCQVCERYGRAFATIVMLIRTTAIGLKQLACILCLLLLLCSEHGNAMKYKNIREVFKSTGEAMTVSGTYYEVLQKGLQKLRADVATFNELATKLRYVLRGCFGIDTARCLRMLIGTRPVCLVTQALRGHFGV